MTATKIAGIVLIALGILALVYGQFSYTKERHEADLGPIELEVNEKRTVNIPTWAGVLAVVAGAVLLILPRKK